VDSEFWYYNSSGVTLFVCRDCGKLPVIYLAGLGWLGKECASIDSIHYAGMHALGLAVLQCSIDYLVYVGHESKTQIVTAYLIPYPASCVQGTSALINFFHWISLTGQT
jgi:hypothetical protein